MSEGKIAVKSYRLPAPWGSVRFETCRDELSRIVPELDRVESPDVAPESICRWMDVVEEMLVHSRVMTAVEKRELFSLQAVKKLFEFSKNVLEFVAGVAPAHIVSYSDVATLISKDASPLAARAVGRALAGNPFPILIGCHRVAPARAIERMTLLEPETLMPEAYLGDVSKRGIAAWLRMQDLAESA